MSKYITYCIYRIVCFPTAMIYVGLASDSKRRKLVHFSMLRSGTHFNSYLQRSFNKYGEPSFYFEILERGISEDDIDDREIYWIAHFDSYHNGFNMTRGGSGKLGHGRKCSWNGIEYPSVAECARANRVESATMWSWIRRGFKTDEDITSINIPCVWDGKQYNSMNEAARVNGIDEATFHHWIKRGYRNRSEVVGRGVHGTKNCTWNGQVYNSVSECADAIGVKIATMYSWIKKGFTCEADVRKLGEQNKRPCVWNGIQYASREDADKANGLSNGVTNYRLRQGYTCDADMKRK